MTIPTVAFFSNKGSVGTTSLVYHLAWMYADLGVPVLAADLDPQANLTAAFLDEANLEDLWNEHGQPRTIYDAIAPLVRGVGEVEDIVEPRSIKIPETPQQLALFGISERQDTGPGALTLIPGDLALSFFEDALSEQWSKCLGGSERASRVLSAFWRVLQKAAAKSQSRVVLMDLGPNLGAINRAALIAADYVVIPLSPDLFSLQGLRNLGPKLQDWRSEWAERKAKNRSKDVELPAGTIQPVGYVVLQPAIRLDRPARAYELWTSRIPGTYREMVLGEPAGTVPEMEHDPSCLALFKHYSSLMPLAQEARKPIFHLKPADGAIGSHFDAVRKVYADFVRLAHTIGQRIGLELHP